MEKESEDDDYEEPFNLTPFIFLLLGIAFGTTGMLTNLRLKTYFK